jgi:hypothetical protein
MCFLNAMLLVAQSSLEKAQKSLGLNKPKPLKIHMGKWVVLQKKRVVLA